MARVLCVNKPMLCVLDHYSVTTLWELFFGSSLEEVYPACQQTDAPVVLRRYDGVGTVSLEEEEEEKEATSAQYPVLYV